MKAFVVAERLREWDGTVFESYGPLAASSIARFGGRYLALSDRLTGLEGPPPPLAMAVIEFPNLEQAQAWYASSEYQQAAAIRRSGAENRFVLIVEGAAAAQDPLAVSSGEQT
ncbi:MAG TPA: DUF1330 domain-containing protein [Dyella sp.]|uniref:DUF1330 domain-containing protein n=1 Tax=Dyella sp. TaxID=1869338 RepID=UPI002F935EEC